MSTLSVSTAAGSKASQSDLTGSTQHNNQHEIPRGYGVITCVLRYLLTENRGVQTASASFCSQRWNLAARASHTRRQRGDNEIRQTEAIIRCGSLSIEQKGALAFWGAARYHAEQVATTTITTTTTTTASHYCLLQIRPF